MSINFKRICSLALALIMICSLIYTGPIEAAAVEETTTPAVEETTAPTVEETTSPETEETTTPSEEETTNVYVCPCHGTPIEEISDWVTFADGVVMEDGKHYKLEAKVTLTSGLTSNVYAINSGKILLNLNGFELNSKSASYRAFSIGADAELTIVDPVGTGAIKGGGNGGAAIALSGKLNLFDALLANRRSTPATTPGNGGVISVNDGAVFNMYSGTLTPDTNGKVEAIAKKGGAVYIASGGEFNFYDGTINAVGTNVASGNGGDAIYVGSSTAKFTMYGGTINAAKAPSGQGLVTINGNYETSHIKGGTINGDVYLLYSNNTITLSGNPYIEELDAGRMQDKNNGGVVLGEGGITGGRIGVLPKLSESNTFISLFNTTDVASSAKYFYGSTIRANAAVTEDGRLELVANNYCEHCKADAEWTKWTGSSSTMKAATADGKHYFLVKNITSGGQAYVGETDVATITVCVDMYGCDAIKAGYRVFAPYNGSTLNLMNSAEKVSVLSTGYTDTGAVINLSGASNLNLYGGMSFHSTAECGNGGNIQVGSGTFTMYGSTLNGGNSSRGGAVHIISGNFVMEDGTINGSKIDGNGGAVSVGEGATFTMNGGTINGGEAGYGGSIYVASGTVNLNGGIVQNGAAGQGGNIYNLSGIVNISKATVSGGFANRHLKNGNTYGGGNILVYGSTAELNITDGAIIENGSTNSQASDNHRGGGNILLVSGLVDIQGGTIKNGTTNASGGNIMTRGGTLKIGGNAVIEGGSAKAAGDSIALRDVDAIISGGNINGEIAPVRTGWNSLVLSGNPTIANLSVTPYTYDETVTDETTGEQTIITHEIIPTIALGQGGVTGGSIAVTVIEGPFSAASDFAATSAEFFSSTDSNLQITATDDGQLCASSAHIWVEYEAVEPGCDTEGNIAYKLCSDCGEAWSLGENPMPLSKYGWVLAATGHIWVNVEAVEPGCNSEGNIAYQYCSVCGYAQTAGENPMPLTKFGWILSATNEHTMEHFDAVEATCDENGHEAYDYCSSCECFFYEDPLKLTYQAGVILATGHTFVNYEAVEATCDQDGNIAYQLCSTCGYAQTWDENPVPLSKFGWILGATGHAWVDVEAVAPSCHADGNIAYQYCSNCGAAQTAGENPMPLSKFGWILTAEHTALEHHDAVEATCEEDGHEAFDYCSDCQVFIYEDALKLTYQDGVIPATGHVWTDIAAVAPDCGNDGNIAYQLCSSCGAAQTAGENPMPLSKYGWVLTATGKHTYIDGSCYICGAEDPDYVPEPSTGSTEIRFELGANGTASHNDGTEFTTKTFTEGDYNLVLTGATKAYAGARDAKGNSCVKLGTSKLVGGFSFTVPDEVTEVVIYAAKYKTNTSNLSVNGTTYTLSGASNNGEYDEIVVDTSVNKTVSVTTVGSTYRAMINAIVYKISSGAEDNSSKLTTNIGTLTFTVGQAQEFEFSTIANGDAGKMVIGSSNFSDASAIEKLEYYEVNDGQWYELTGDFGPATGFPMSDATSKFRVTFAKAGKFTFTAVMKSVETGDVLCYVQATAKVYDPDGKVLTIAEAIAMGKAMEHNTYTDTKYTVTGVITEVYNTQYGNMRLTDEEGNILTIYGTYSADGKDSYQNMEVKPVAGEQVTIYGIVGQYSGTAQIKNGWIVDHIHSVHTWVDYAAVEPTCNTDGNIAYQLCSICGAAQTAGENPVPLGKFGWVLGAQHTGLEHHDAIEATCDMDGHYAFDYCADCEVFIYEDPLMLTYQDGVILATGHTWTDVEAVDPTCDMDGNIAYQLCSSCGAAQTAGENPMPLSKFGWVLAATGHSFVDHEAVDPTCDTDGNIAYQQCSICGYAQTAGENPVPLSRFGWVLGATGHAWVDVEAVDPTCDMDGNIAYQYCSNCGAAQTAGENPMPLSKFGWVLAATGHSFVDHEAVAPTCETEGNIAYQQCSECGYAQTWEETPLPLSKFGWILGVVHTVEHVEAQASTLKAEGNVEYWYCTTCGAAWLDENQNQVTNLLSVKLPKLNGDYNNDGEVTNDDVLTLLWCTLFPSQTQIQGDLDLNNDGEVTNDDVLTLLWYTLFRNE